MIFDDLRITAVPETCSWKIERSFLINDDDGSSHHEWIECLHIPGHLPREFKGNL